MKIELTATMKSGSEVSVRLGRIVGLGLAAVADSGQSLGPKPDPRQRLLVRDLTVQGAGR